MFNPDPFEWELFRAAGEDKAFVELQEGLELVVRGFPIDTVDWVGQVRPPERHSLATLVRWIVVGLDAAKKNCSKDGKQYESDPSTTIVDAYLRTLIGDTTDYEGLFGLRASGMDMLMFTLWFKWLQERFSPGETNWASTEPAEGYKNVYESFMHRTQSRKLFTTASQRVGLGIATVHGDMREVMMGDEVFLLQGCNVPVVLRPLSTSDVEQPDGPSNFSPTSRSSAKAISRRYAFIGTSYVHGIMDGEAYLEHNEKLVDIHLGVNLPPPEKVNAFQAAMRDAHLWSNIHGHDSKHESNGYTPWKSRRSETETVEDSPEACVDAETLLFPEPRQFDESLKPTTSVRAWASSVFQGTPTTEEGWKELFKSIAEKDPTKWPGWLPEMDFEQYIEQSPATRRSLRLTLKGTPGAIVSLR
jgi:hypothetical protein